MPRRYSVATASQITLAVTLTNPITHTDATMSVQQLLFSCVKMPGLMCRAFSVWSADISMRQSTLGAMRGNPCQPVATPCFQV